MINQLDNWYYVACDTCEFEESFDDLDFYDVIKKLKSSGWIVKKVGGEWLHYCCKLCSES